MSIVNRTFDGQPHPDWPPPQRPLSPCYKVGTKIKFREEKLRYTVQAANERYAVCTKPFNAKRTVLYTIIDVNENVRGTENLIFGMGAETRKQCEEMLARLTDPESPTEVSHRNRITLRIEVVCAG